MTADADEVAIGHLPILCDRLLNIIHAERGLEAVEPAWAIFVTVDGAFRPRPTLFARSTVLRLRDDRIAEFERQGLPRTTGPLVVAPDGKGGSEVKRIDVKQ